MSARIRAYIRQHHLALICLFLLLSGGTAQALSGSNTVFSDDIVNGEVKNADLAANVVNSPKVVNNSLTGADINQPPWRVVAPNPQTDTDPCDLGESARFCGKVELPSGFWRNFGGDYQTARFYRDAAGQVHIQGLVQLVGVLEPAIFLLPVGYRPAQNLVFGVDCSENVDENPQSGVEHGRIDIIASTGEVLWSDAFDNCNTRSYISLMGIEFRAEE